MVDDRFRYWAFLSYSSKDSAFAKKLHRRLERYRYPRDLVGRPGRDGPVPRKIFPVFRDREELPLSADLGSTIEDALRASRYLIVVCSPHAAKSRWVNEEIRHFKTLGRSDRILALIIDGEPNAADHGNSSLEECFPPALKYAVDANGHIGDQRTEPIAGDLRKGGDGWQLAFSKAVAGIAGIGLDAIVRRERKRRRRRLLAEGVCLVACIAGGLWTWDAYFREYRDYFNGAQNRYGEYFGVEPIPNGNLHNYERALEFRHIGRRNPVSQIRTVNGDGDYVEPLLGGISVSILGQLGTNYSSANAKVVTKITLTRAQDKHVVKEAAFYFDGSLAYVFNYLDEGVVSFQVGGIERQRAPGIASRAKFAYHQTGPGAGFMRKVQLMDAYGHPARLDVGPFADQFPGFGIYGIETEIKSKAHRLCETTIYFLNETGERMILDNFLSFTFLIDEKGRFAGGMSHSKDPNSGEVYDSLGMELTYGSNGGIDTMRSHSKASADAASVDTMGKIDSRASRLEFHWDKGTGYAYLGERGRKLLNDFRFDMFLFAKPNEDGVITILLLMPSTQYRNGFYEIPSYVFIQGFVEESPGRTAGLQIGDIILTYEQKPLHAVEELIDAIAARADNVKEAQITILRDGVVSTKTLPAGKLGARVGTTTSMTREMVEGTHGD